MKAEFGTNAQILRYLLTRVVDPEAGICTLCTVYEALYASLVVFCCSLLVTGCSVDFDMTTDVDVQKWEAAEMERRHKRSTTSAGAAPAPTITESKRLPSALTAVAGMTLAKPVVDVKSQTSASTNRDHNHNYHQNRAAEGSVSYALPSEVRPYIVKAVPVPAAPFSGPQPQPQPQPYGELSPLAFRALARSDEGEREVSYAVPSDVRQYIVSIEANSGEGQLPDHAPAPAADVKSGAALPPLPALPALSGVNNSTDVQSNPFAPTGAQQGQSQSQSQLQLQPPLPLEAQSQSQFGLSTTSTGGTGELSLSDVNPFTMLSEPALSPRHHRQPQPQQSPLIADLDSDEPGSSPPLLPAIPMLPSINAGGRGSSVESASGSPPPITLLTPAQAQAQSIVDNVGNGSIAIGGEQPPPLPSLPALPPLPQFLLSNLSSTPSPTSPASMMSMSDRVSAGGVDGLSSPISVASTSVSAPAALSPPSVSLGGPSVPSVHVPNMTINTGSTNDSTGSGIPMLPPLLATFDPFGNASLYNSTTHATIMTSATGAVEGSGSSSGSSSSASGSTPPVLPSLFRVQSNDGDPFTPLGQSVRGQTPQSLTDGPSPFTPHTPSGLGGTAFIPTLPPLLSPIATAAVPASAPIMVGNGGRDMKYSNIPILPIAARLQVPQQSEGQPQLQPQRLPSLSIAAAPAVRSSTAADTKYSGTALSPSSAFPSTSVPGGRIQIGSTMTTTDVKSVPTSVSSNAAAAAIGAKQVSHVPIGPLSAKSPAVALPPGAYMRPRPDVRVMSLSPSEGKSFRKSVRNTAPLSRHISHLPHRRTALIAAVLSDGAEQSSNNTKRVCWPCWRIPSSCDICWLFLTRPKRKANMR